MTHTNTSRRSLSLLQGSLALLVGSGLVLVSAPAVWAAPAPETPGRDAPGRDAPGRDAPGRDAPGRDAPGRDAPGRDAPRLVPIDEGKAPRPAPDAAAPGDAGPDPAAVPLLLAEARLAAAAGRTSDALDLCSKALATDRQNAEARLLRGALLGGLGRWREAEQDLQAAAWKRPRDLALGRLLARAFREQGKWMWAARQLGRLAELSPRDGSLWLAFGHALHRLDEKAEARAALGKAIALGPERVANPARVLLAIILREEGKLREARHLAAAVRGPAGEEAQALTGLIYAAEGRADRGLSLTFRTGTSYDSNVSMDPVDQRGSGSRGWLFDLGARLAWNAHTWGRHSVGLGAGLHRTFVLNWWDKATCAPDYSLLSASIAPFYALRFATGAVDHELRLGYRGQVITLDGSCQKGDELYVFSESHGGALGWEMKWSDKSSTHLHVDAGTTLFHQQVRDQSGAALEVGQSIFLAGRRVKLYPELHVRYEGARGDHWSLVALRPSLALSALLPGKLDLLFWADLEHQRYPESQGHIPWLLGSEEDRADLILRAGLSVGRALTSWLRADLAYRYRWNRSNVEAYDYQRHVVGLTFTAQVDLWKPGAAKKKKGKPQ